MRGHRGEVVSLLVGGNHVLVFRGGHLYEGRSAHEAVHAVRTAVAAGCHTVILTNSSGSLDPAITPGSIVAISDHLNLTGRTPLIGLPFDSGSPTRFVDQTALWSTQLRALVGQLQPDVVHGVYAQVLGPQFETPAEIRMLRSMGADLVGMSTALEALAAVHAGAEVLGLSLVSNLAAGSAARVTVEDIRQAGVTGAPTWPRSVPCSTTPSSMIPDLGQASRRTSNHVPTPSATTTYADRTANAPPGESEWAWRCTLAMADPTSLGKNWLTESLSRRGRPAG